MGTLWKFTLRQIQRRPGRACLTLLGIMIGVATIVAISATTRAANRAYKEMFDAIGGKAELEIVTEGDSGFPLAQVQNIENLPEVRKLIGVVHKHAGIKTKTGPTIVLALGLSPTSKADRTYQVVEGRKPENDWEIAIGKGYAQTHQLSINQELELVPSRDKPLKIVGFLDATGVGVFDGGAVMVTTLATAQTVFKLPEKVNSVQVILAEGVDKAQAKAKIASLLPTGLRAQEPFARGMLAQEGTLSTEMALDALSVVSLVGGAFVILNSFLMNLGERRKQLAILRALGTTRSQIMRLLLREAVFMGVIGTALGLGLGVLLAKGLIAMQEQLLQAKLPPLKLTFEPFLMGLIVGPGMALAATWIPARRAGNRPPLEAMMARRATPSEKPRRWAIYVGFVALLLATFMVFGLTQNWWSGPSAKILLGPSMSLMLFGCVLSLPIILKPLQALTARLLKPLLGLEGSLAMRQMERQHTRTGLTVGVLFIGVIVTVGFGNALLDSVDDIYTWYHETIQADYLVRGVMPRSSTLAAVELDPKIGDEIAKVDGVEKPVGKVNFIIPVMLSKPGVKKKTTALLLARTVVDSRPIGLAIVHGNESDVRAGLKRGEVVLGTTLAQRIQARVGDQINLGTFFSKTRTLRVCGVVKEYTVGGMAFYLDWTPAQKMFNFKGVHTFEVTLKDKNDLQAKTALKKFCQERSLLLHANEDVRAVVDQNIESVVGFLWCLIALMFVVASLGIINTLTMNILEQTREVGVLRAIGLKRGQIRKMVLAQAIAMAIVSVIPGIVVGILLAWIMNTTTPALSGHHVDFHLHPLFIAMCAVVALVVSFLAACLPARRAAKIDMIQALQYE